jgi:hypothetical protein
VDLEELIAHASSASSVTSAYCPYYAQREQVGPEPPDLVLATLAVLLSGEEDDLPRERLEGAVVESSPWVLQAYTTRGGGGDPGGSDDAKSALRSRAAVRAASAVPGGPSRAALVPPWREATVSRYPKALLRGFWMSGATLTPEGPGEGAPCMVLGLRSYTWAPTCIRALSRLLRDFLTLGLTYLLAILSGHIHLHGPFSVQTSFTIAPPSGLYHGPRVSSHEVQSFEKLRRNRGGRGVGGMREDG